MTRQTHLCSSCATFAIVGLGLALAGGACPARAQLISPGKLSEAHADLEGVRNCTNCHRLRERGVANDLCLQCHEPERHRIEQRRGYHATVADRNCAVCHKEHFGRYFAVVRFDTASFDHSEVGFDLVERHAELDCRECHRPELIVAADVRVSKEEHGALDRTFLGLGTSCRACHTADDPHGDQFSDRTCTDCHSQTQWNPTEGFDHDRTDYPLTGRHRDAVCRGCHETLRGGDRPMLRYAGVAFGRCTDCHRDEHQGGMGTDCSRCHATEGWMEIARGSFERDFRHEHTEFPLRGAHADVTCAICHTLTGADVEGIRLSFATAERNRAYPRPAADDCLSCHLDYHDGAFVTISGGATCRSCHTETAWLPATYDIPRHNDGETFVLTGAHLATPCGDCHRSAAWEPDTLRFRMPHERCRDCHDTDDPHGTQFADRPCTDCHDTETFHVASFDHDKTRFPLDGRHRDVDCGACHPTTTDASGHESRLYRPLGTRCEDCHGGGI